MAFLLRRLVLVRAGRLRGVAPAGAGVPLRRAGAGEVVGVRRLRVIFRYHELHFARHLPDDRLQGFLDQRPEALLQLVAGKDVRSADDEAAVLLRHQAALR